MHRGGAFLRGVCTAIGATAIAAWAAGCAPSEIEPRSAASVEGASWDPFAPDLARLAPRGMTPPDPATDTPTSAPPAPHPLSQEALQEAMPLPPFDPAPVRARPRSISLGFVGDEPLTPSPSTAPRWPWVQERFHHDAPSYSYGVNAYPGWRRR